MPTIGLARLARRTTVAVGATVSLVSATLVFPGLLAVADAHNSGVQASASSCAADGSWTATWKVTNDFSTAATAFLKVSTGGGTLAPSLGTPPTGPSASIPARANNVDGSVTFTQSGLSLSQADATFSVFVRWAADDFPNAAGTGREQVGGLWYFVRSSKVSQPEGCNTGNTGNTGYTLTVVSRYCPTYDDVQGNRANNNLRETLGNLTIPAAPPYGSPMSGNPVSPDREYVTPSQRLPANGGKCRPIDNWDFTLGTGYTGGTPANLSQVTGKLRSLSTETGGTPQLQADGTPDGSKTVLGAHTYDLTTDEVSRAKKPNSLWIQGGKIGDQLNGQSDRYSFASLRCAVDNLNGDNVEYVQYTGGTKHVYCYAYYVAKLDYGKVIVKKMTTPSSTDSFAFGSNVSFGNDGNFTVQAGSQSDTFIRSVTQKGDTPWYVEEKSGSAQPAGWVLDSFTCTTTSQYPSTITYVGRRAVITLTKGDVVTCTYTNRQVKARIEVTKHDTTLDGPTLPGATYTLSKDSDGTPGAQIGDPVTTGADGTAGWGGISTGTYQVCETAAPTGYLLADPACKKVVVERGDDGKTVSIGFANLRRETATIVVEKVVDDASGAQEQFGFTLTGQDGFSLAGRLASANPAEGIDQRTFGDLPTGVDPYVLQESALPTGWTLDNISCSTKIDGEGGSGLAGTPTGGVAITLRASDVVTCIVTNAKTPEQVGSTVTLTGNGICPNNTPFLTYRVNGAPEGATVTYTVTNTKGRVISTGTVTDNPGRLLWPNAAVDANGNPVQWPGWEQQSDGTWIPAPTQVLPGVTLRVDVATGTGVESAKAFVAYPTGGAGCRPVNGSTTPGNNSPLPRTGSSVALLLTLGGLGVVLGLALMVLGAYLPRRTRITA